MAVATPIEIGTLITRKPGGRPIVAGAGISVRAIALDSNQGMSAEEIVADRPPLNLAQVHAALAYYFANREEVDADIVADELAYEAGVRAAPPRR